MSVLLLKIAPWLAGVLLVFGVGTYAGYRANPWQARYHALQLTDAQERAEGEAAVRKAMEGQLKQAQAVSANNADSMVQLANENAQIAHDRDANMALARRLLAGQARSAPTGNRVSQAANQPRTPPAGGTGTHEDIAGLLVDTADECDRNANRLDSLIAELMPQL